MLFLLPVLGLEIRSHQSVLPLFLAAYAPDTLWALLVFAVVVSLAPRLPNHKAALLALALALLIEISQLYQAPWIHSWRATTLGGLLLGRGFLWSDLVCYMVGIASSALLNHVLLRMSD